jgi:hypothetical protein
MEPGIYEVKAIILRLFKSTIQRKLLCTRGSCKYIDIQYIIQGVELMGVTTKKKISKLTKFRRRLYIYSGETSLRGRDVYYFPDDLHIFCAAGQSSKVKVVVKVGFNKPSLCTKAFNFIVSSILISLLDVQSRN